MKTQQLPIDLIAADHGFWQLRVDVSPCLSQLTGYDSTSRENTLPTRPRPAPFWPSDAPIRANESPRATGRHRNQPPI